MEFSTREIATGIWMAVILLFLIVKVRDGSVQVIRAFFQPAIQKIVVLMLGYVAVCVALLAWRDLWDIANLKTTILWTVAVGLVGLFQANKIDEETHFFRKSVKEALAFTVIVEFLISTYTFSLWAELLLIPFLVFLTALTTVAKSQPGSVQVVTLLEWLLALIGFWLVGHAIYEAALHFHELRTADQARELMVPILLSLMFLPFLYALNIFIVYERIFTTLQFSIKDPALRRYAQRRALIGFRADIDLVKRWRRLVNMEPPETRADVKARIQEVRETRERQRDPLPVDPADGWQPTTAIHFLDSEGFTNEDYHHSFDNWVSGSNFVRPVEGAFLDSIVYCVSGSQDIANLLELKLYVGSAEKAAAVDERFGEVCGKLILAAIGIEGIAALDDQLGDAGEFEAETSGYRIFLKRENWPNQMGAYERRLSLSPIKAA